MGWSLRSLPFSVAYILSVNSAPVLCRDPYEASHGRAATRAALRTAGLQELAAQDARMAARARAAERQGTGLSA